MSLVKKPVMTGKNLSAHRRNAQRSGGATTPQGKERGRAANLRHGAYSQIRDEALLALGENPAQFAALVDGAHDQWRPANPFQGWIVERLARLQWRVQRAERMQESLAAQRIERALKPRREATLELRRRYVPRADFLAILQENAARPDFYAPPGYFREFHEAFDGMPTKRTGEIHRLMHRLRKPRQFPSAPVSAPAGATTDEDWRERVEEMEAVKFPISLPKIPVAEGGDRDPWRQELQQLVLEEQQVSEKALDELVEENGIPLTTFERDHLAASVDGQIDLLRRQEESCFRQFWRMGSFLMKLQDRQDRMEQSEYEVSPQESEVCGDDADAAGPEFSVNENEGASGDLNENTRGDVGQGMAERRTTDSNDSQEAPQARIDSSEKRVESDPLPSDLFMSQYSPGDSEIERGGEGERVGNSDLSDAA